MHDGPHHLPHPHGHNARRDAMQWQTPHLSVGHVADTPPQEHDVDLVEASFIEGFAQTSDATSFLRLAGIPFVGVRTDGTRLTLLRVEIEDLTDVGSATPLLGGEGFRYDPLPERMVSRRRLLHFAYHDGKGIVRLHFAGARGLRAE